MFFAGTALVASEGAPYPDPDQYKVPCGKVTEMKLSTKQDFALKWSVPKFKEEPALEANEKFAEVFIQVAQGFSLGKYDFELSGNKCLAMAEGAGTYDPETREIVADAGERTVKMLFKVKATADVYDLIFKYSTKDALSTSLPETLKRVQLPLFQGAGGGGDAAMAPKGDAKDDEKKADKKKTGKKKDAKKKKDDPTIDEKW
jgi:hypothetical protein